MSLTEHGRSRQRSGGTTLSSYIRTASLAFVVAFVAVAALTVTGGTSAAHAQGSPTDVPWDQIPEDLKEAIKTQAEADGKPFNLAYADDCREDDDNLRGKLCARVLTLGESTARVCIGLFRAECTFFDFTKSTTGWAGVRVTPGPPDTGNAVGVGRRDGVSDLALVFAVLLLATAGSVVLIHRGRRRI